MLPNIIRLFNFSVFRYYLMKKRVVLIKFDIYVTIICIVFNYRFKCLTARIGFQIELKNVNFLVINYCILRLFYLSRQISIAGYFLLYTVTGWTIAFSYTCVTYYCWVLGTFNPVHFLLTENNKRYNQGIII